MSNQIEVDSFSAQPVSSDFTNVPLESDKPKKKVPRRLIHFSDGVLEEYSTDEEDETPPPPAIDPKSLTWGPWMWYYVSSAALKTLGVADACGEKLAWFFGITTPKYQSAIDEFYRLKAEEEKELEYERRAREKMQELSSIDVKIIDQPRDKGSRDDPGQKF